MNQNNVILTATSVPSSESCTEHKVLKKDGRSTATKVVVVVVVAQAYGFGLRAVRYTWTNILVLHVSHSTALHPRRVDHCAGNF
jgi:hypothetical protein